MKDQLIKAIGIFTELYPTYDISNIYLWDTDENNNKVTYKIYGIKGTSEISDRITIDL